MNTFPILVSKTSRRRLVCRAVSLAGNVRGRPFWSTFGVKWRTVLWTNARVAECSGHSRYLTWHFFISLKFIHKTRVMNWLRDFSILLYFYKWSLVSSASIVTRLRAGRRGLYSRHGGNIFGDRVQTATSLSPARGAGRLFPREMVWIKPLGREADSSSPFSAEGKNAWMCTCSPPYIFLALYSCYGA
jgi:hypothetical protein